MDGQQAKALFDPILGNVDYRRMDVDLDILYKRSDMVGLRYIVLLVLLSSCGSVYHSNQIRKHQRKIEKHLNWLQDHGAKFNTDTLYKQLGITVPSVNLKFETRVVSGKTEVINFKRPEGEVNLSFIEDTSGNKTVTPEVTIKEKIVYRDVPYKVETIVECKQNWRTMEVIGYITIALIIGAVAMYFLKLFRVIP